MKQDEFFHLFKENKKLFNRVLGLIKTEDKKAVLIAIVKSTEKEKEFKDDFSIKTNKTVIDPSEMVKMKVFEIRANINRGFELSMKFNGMADTTTAKDSIPFVKSSGRMGLDDEDLATNMVKEQLYLPIWKLLIKIKRHANKRLRTSEKQLGKLYKELEPFIVSEKLLKQEVSE